MKPKTKAQELGFLSRDYAVAKDKQSWLDLFAEDAIVQDPSRKDDGHQSELGPDHAKNPQKVDENQNEIGGRIILDPLRMAMIHLHLHTWCSNSSATE